MYTYELTPRYLEVDQLGVVFNMWYLGYFDEAMAAFLGHLGRPYPELVAGGNDVMLVRTELDWSDALRYGQTARIEITVESVGSTSFVLRFDIVHEMRVTCRARTVYVFVDSAQASKRPIPDDLRVGLVEHLAAGVGGPT